MNEPKNEIWEYLKSLPPPGPFKPSWYYCGDGDILEVIWENTNYHAEWLQDTKGIHLLKADDDNRVIGVCIWGFKKTLKDDE